MVRPNVPADWESELDVHSHSDAVWLPPQSEIEDQILTESPTVLKIEIKFRVSRLVDPTRTGRRKIITIGHEGLRNGVHSSQQVIDCVLKTSQVSGVNAGGP